MNRTKLTVSQASEVLLNASHSYATVHPLNRLTDTKIHTPILKHHRNWEVFKDTCSAHTFSLTEVQHDF